MPHDGITVRRLPSGSHQARAWDPIARRYHPETRATAEEAMAAARQTRARYVLGLDSATPCSLATVWAAYAVERYGVTVAQIEQVQAGELKASDLRFRGSWATVTAMARTMARLRDNGHVTDLRDRQLRTKVAAWFAGLHIPDCWSSDGRAAAATQRRMLAQVRALLAFARDAGLLVGGDPLARMRIGQREGDDGPREVYTLDEARRLVALDAVNDPVWVHAVMCLYAGLRTSEARAAQWNDYDEPRRLLWVRKAKGKKRRNVVVQPELAAILARAPRRRPEDPIAAFTGPDVYQHFTALLVRAKITYHRGEDPITLMPRRLTRHSLRHTYCAAMLATGEPGDLLRILMGHSSEDLTQHYGAQAATYRVEVQREGWPRGELRFASPAVDNPAHAGGEEHGLHRKDAPGSGQCRPRRK